MKCAYKKVVSQQKLEAVCRRYGTMFLQYCDASLAVRMHELFGFGAAKRLTELFDVMNPRLNWQMSALVEDEGEDLWETTRNTHRRTTKKIIDAVGWDPGTVTEELPVMDRWKPMGIGRFDRRDEERQRNLHIFRKNHIDTMEVKLGVYWNMNFLGLITDHGFGKGRLERLYRALREDYIAFAERYLMCDRESDGEVWEMIREFQKKAEAFGVKFEYDDVSGVPVRKGV